MDCFDKSPIQKSAIPNPKSEIPSHVPLHPNGGSLTGIRIKSNIDVQENNIPSTHKTVIYRILQEALNNIAKHSGADQVTLSLVEQANRVILIVQDNGVGFDVSKTISMTPSLRGFGLASMSERAGLSGADFQITSEADKGTTIRVEWDV